MKYYLHFLKGNISCSCVRGKFKICWILAQIPKTFLSYLYLHKINYKLSTHANKYTTLLFCLYLVVIYAIGLVYQASHRGIFWTGKASSINHWNEVGRNDFVDPSPELVNLGKTVRD